MTTPISKVEINNFKKRMKEITNEELKLRADLKALYAQLVLDVGDSEIALRHVRQAFFQIQKSLYQKFFFDYSKKKYLNGIIKRILIGNRNYLNLNRNLALKKGNIAENL